jgi:hypothetical protein
MNLPSIFDQSRRSNNITTRVIDTPKTIIPIKIGSGLARSSVDEIPKLAKIGSTIESLR